jgi:transcriptional regulator with XRE-family HTH domain
LPTSSPKKGETPRLKEPKQAEVCLTEYTKEMVRNIDQTPGEWAQAINNTIRHLLVEKRMTGRKLAEHMNRSNTYVAKRLRGEAAFTLNDIDTMGKSMGFDGGAFLASINTPKEISELKDVTYIHNGMDLRTVPVELLLGAASTMQDSRHLETERPPKEK